MNPLLDEKIVVILSQVTIEYFTDNFLLNLKRDGYGPSLNEGISFEYAAYVEFTGDFSGLIFLCMDGATKLKLLPQITKKFHVDKYQKGMANSILMEMVNQISSLFIEEFSYAKVNLKLNVPESMNNKIFIVEFSEYRQYYIIYNIFNENYSTIIGRLYQIILLKK